MKPFWKLSLLGAALVASAAARAADPVDTINAAYPAVIGGYQPPPRSDSAKEGQGTYVDGFLLKLDMGVSLGHDSNVNLSNDQDPLVSSDFVLYSPTLTVSRNLGAASHVEAYYSGQLMRYGSASSFDYSDSSVGGVYSKEWTARLKTTFKVDYTLGHDTANSYVDNTGNVERWSSPMLQATVHYGANGAKGQLELEADYREQHYTTDPSVMDAYNLDQSRVVGRFFYRVQPKTQAVFELADERDDYPNTPSANATQQRLTVGAKWDATAQTTGQVMFGMMRMSNDLSGSGNSGLAWDATVTYTPRSYSKFTLDGSRQYNEWANNMISYEISQGATLGWEYGWTPRVTSTVSLLDYNDDYLGSARRDQRNGAGIKLSYAFGRRYHLGLEDTVQKRSSNEAQWNFDENITMLTFDAAL